MDYFNKNRIPTIAFAAYSGTGKTTLVEKLVANLKAKGLRVAVIKHDAHGIDIDREGKDSWRFAKAGADVVIVSSKEKTFCVEQRELSFEQVLSKVQDVDLILVEGYKNEPLPQIGICRKETGKGFTAALGRYEAIVTDLRQEELYSEELWKDDADLAERQQIPYFHFDEVEKITEFIMERKEDFTHFNEQGRAKMVDVGVKDVTCRKAVAAASVLVNVETFSLIKTGGMKKGDVLTVAQIAGVMGAKRTSDLIPMCHPILIDGVNLNLSLNEEKCSVEIEATVSCSGRTGVEMEALTAVSTAALTVYDMCKAVQKDIVITDIRLLEKTGGVHGDYHGE